MRKKIISHTLALCLGVFVLSFLIGLVALAWTLQTAEIPNFLRLRGLTVDSYTYLATKSGKVGIGTTRPAAKLAVVSSADEILRLERFGASNPVKFKVGATDSAFIINAQNSDVLTIKNGNVGIGTTNPMKKLEVNGTILSNGNVYAQSPIEGYKNRVVGIGELGTAIADWPGKIIYGIGWNWKPFGIGVSIPENETFGIYGWKGTAWGGTANLYVSGKVGIGTANPAQKLDVNGTAKMTGFQLGSSTTAGYVLTANTSGVGTWQSAPANGTTTETDTLQSVSDRGKITSNYILSKRNFYWQSPTYPNPNVIIGIGELQSAKADFPTAKIYGVGWDKATGAAGWMVPTGMGAGSYDLNGNLENFFAKNFYVGKAKRAVTNLDVVGKSCAWKDYTNPNYIICPEPEKQTINGVDITNKKVYCCYLRTTE